MSALEGTARVIAFTTDMIFSTKITSTARELDVPSRSLTRLGRLTTINADDAKLVLIDMDAAEAVDAIKFAAGLASKPKVIAFYSHVKDELREAAKEAGATDVMTRSRFTECLPELLKECV